MARFFFGAERKKGQKSASKRDHASTGKTAGLVGIICNMLLFIGKLTVGLLAGSISIVADGFNNLSDASAAVITYVGFHLSRRPADKEHPYGHARYEYLSGLGISIVILLMGIELIKSSVKKILQPAPVELGTVTVLVLLGSVAVKLWMTRYYASRAKSIGSETLRAAAKDSRNDVIATSAVLLSALISRYFQVELDGYISLAVALFILWSGICIARDTGSLILGRQADARLEEMICRTVLAREKVLDVHDFLYHDYGHGRSYASIHVEFDAAEDPLTCHGIIDELEREVYERWHVRLLIHYDPVLTNSTEWNEMKAWVQAAAKEMDDSIAIHDFRIVAVGKEKKLIFDLELPYALFERKKEIRRHIIRRLAEEGRPYTAEIFFDAV